MPLAVVCQPLLLVWAHLSTSPRRGSGTLSDNSSLFITVKQKDIHALVCNAGHRPEYLCVLAGTGSEYLQQTAVLPRQSRGIGAEEMGNLGAASH